MMTMRKILRAAPMVALALVLATPAMTSAAQSATIQSSAAQSFTAQSSGVSEWRVVTPDALWVLDTDKGRILIELMPDVAPANVERIRTLTRQGFYDGLKFHRVIRDFMVQGGDPLGTGLGGSDLPDLPGEFTFRRGNTRAFTVVPGTAGQGLFGLYGALPVLTQPDAQMYVTADNRVDATGQFCPGVVGMARGQGVNSANSQFYMMIGVQPMLNGQYTPLGRVLSGLDVVGSIKRGEGDEGTVVDPDTIVRARLAADIAEGERPVVRVADPRSALATAAIDQARAEKGPRFSICDVQLPVEVD